MRSKGVSTPLLDPCRGNLGERMGIQAGAADQHAVYVIDTEQVGGVGRLYRASVQDWRAHGGREAQSSIEPSPKHPVGICRVVRSRSFPGADGPDRFVRDQEGSEVTLKRLQRRIQLREDDLIDPTVLSLRKGLSHANHRR